MGDFFAFLQNEHVRADFLEEVEEMRAEDDGGALTGAAEDGILHATDAEGVEAGEGLVEEHDPGAVQESAGDGEFLLHAAGELAGELVGFFREFEFFEEWLGEGRVVGDAVYARDEVEVLADREVVEEPGFVGEKRELALGGDGIGGEIDTANADGAAVGGDDAGEAAERAGFAGAVGADEAEDLAGLNGERQITDGGEIAVAFGEARDFDHGRRTCGGWRTPASPRKSHVTATGAWRLGGIGQNGRFKPQKIIPMKSTVKLLFALFTLGFVAAAPLAQAAGEKPAKVAQNGKRLKAAVEERDKQLTEKLKLTAEQQEKLAALRKEQGEALKAVRGDRAKMAEAAKTAHDQVRAILTADQQKEFDAMKPEGRGGKKGKKAGGES